jgi:chemotaxis protein CheD
VGVVYDGFKRIGGMIHVMSPLSRKDDLTEMIRDLEALGACRTFMQARIIGGAKVLSGKLNAGEMNRSINREALEREKIPVVYEDTGDNLVRNVRFFIRDGTIIIRRKKINENHEEDHRIECRRIKHKRQDGIA